jgi:hypothetical protein
MVFLADLGQATHFTPCKQWVGSLQAHLSFFWLQATRLLAHYMKKAQRGSESPSAYLLLQEAYSGW